jgi:hypothetical protein
MYEQGKFICHCGSKEAEIEYLQNGQTHIRMIDNKFMVSNIDFIVCAKCGLMYNYFYYNYNKVKVK